MTSFYSLNYEDLVRICSINNLPPQSARLLFNWHYKKSEINAYSHQNLSTKAKDFVREHISFSLPKIQEIKESDDKTVKFLFRLSDESAVESVLIPFQNKYTICLSSQVGCAMACTFCFTGKQGYKRNLTTDEIIGQFMAAKIWLNQNRSTDNRILNVVFMGQGEPLANFEPVKKSCEIFISQFGLSLAAHKITVSTSGFVPGINRWKNEMPPVNLALSLHAANSEKRNEIIPLNKKYALAEVLEAIDEIPLAEKRFVTYEYLVLKDFNHSEDDLHRLGQLLATKKAYINLIPFNPFPDSTFERPSSEILDHMKKVLESEYRIPTTIRTTKGDEIFAACGQLNTKLTTTSVTLSHQLN